MEDGNERREILGKALLFTETSLGPASERIVSRPEVQAMILSRIRAGAQLEDAVLAEVHRGAREDRGAANEFLALLMQDAQRSGSRFVPAHMRRFLDTGDLIQSVLGDMWIEVFEFRFETRGQFLSLLTQRLRWKSIDTNRKMKSQRRGGGRLSSEDVGDLPIADERPTPASSAMSREEREQLVLRILRLPERDQTLVRMHLRGDMLETMVATTGLQPETARKALQRALRKLRDGGSG